MQITDNHKLHFFSPKIQYKNSKYSSLKVETINRSQALLTWLSVLLLHSLTNDINGPCSVSSGVSKNKFIEIGL